MKRLLGLSLCALMVVGYGCGGGEKPAATQESQPAKVAAKPGAPADLANGKAVYDRSCFACHATGVLGAAALTDKARWTKNASKKMDVLVKNVHDGFTGEYGTMTPMGTCMDCTDKDLYDAIHYIMDEAGVTPTY